MSYILDALKKIEHEKNKKRPDGRFNISGDLFQERKRLPVKNGVWKIVALMVVASLVAAASGWFMFKGKKTTGSAVIRQSAPIPIPAPPQVTAPPVQIPVQVPAPMVVSPVTPAIPAPQENIEEEGDDDSSARRARFRNKQGNTPPVAQKLGVKTLQTSQTIQTVQAPADIKLSGIAWQDDRSGRRAVINGFLLREGAVVSGARITDIQADKVRFASSAGIFEIKLDAVLPAEVKK